MPDGGAPFHVGEFAPARAGSVNAAGVVNDRDDRVDVVFRRVVFQLDGVAGRPVTNVRKVVSPRPDPTLAQPAVDVTFIDDDLRVTDGEGDGGAVTGIGRIRMDSVLDNTHIFQI